MKTDRNAPIGVFDSGVGGLTVAREIMRNLPMEKIVYFGDTARVPYGSKSKETVIRYSRQIVRFLQKQGVKAIVIACNTASALALDTLEKEIDIPIIGVVKPGARVAGRRGLAKRSGHRDRGPQIPERDAGRKSRHPDPWLYPLSTTPRSDRIYYG